MAFALLILFLIVLVGGVLVLCKTRFLSEKLLHKTAFISAFFVPIMGATSIFYAMMGGFHALAVIIGVVLFIVQWWCVFRSRRFQKYWGRTPFKYAFIINSLLRLPISFYIDPLLFMVQLQSYEAIGIVFESGGAWRGTEEFMSTLYLTLSHGVVVQIVYALCLFTLYGMCIVIARMLNKPIKS